MIELKHLYKSFEDKEVLNIDSVKTRLFGDRVFVDVEIAVDGNKLLYDAHQVANDVHNRIEAEYPQVKHCMVHVNPAQTPDAD